MNIGLFDLWSCTTSLLCKILCSIMRLTLWHFSRMFSLALVVVVVLGKMRLFVRVRSQGCRIESVPLKRLLKLASFRKRRWELKDGWLILEAF